MANNIPTVIMRVIIVEENELIILPSFQHGHRRIDLPGIHIPRQHGDVFLGLIQTLLHQLAAHYPTAPTREFNPLLSLLTLNADAFGVTLGSSGDSFDIGLFPLFIPPAASMSESSSDDEQPGSSHLLVNSEDRPSQFPMSESAFDDQQPGPSHLVVNSKARPDQLPMSESSIVDEQPGHNSGPDLNDVQPGTFHKDTTKIRSGGSTRSSSQVEIIQGVKRKRKSSGRSENRKWKRMKLDHSSDSDSFHSFETFGDQCRDDNGPGPSHRDNGEMRESADQRSDCQGEMRQAAKRNQKRIKSDYLSDSDNEQPGPSNLVNNTKSRSSESRTSVDQSTRRQTETRQSVKRKRKTSGNQKAEDRKDDSCHSE